MLAADDATLADYRLEPYAALLSKLVADEAPQVVLAAATSRGKELLATSALDADAPLLNDLTELTLDGGALTGIHPVYGGKLLSTLESDAAGPQFATLRSRAFKPLTPDRGPQRRDRQGRAGPQ